MYACLYQYKEAPDGQDRLIELARAFSPSIEVTDARTLLFSIDGLGRLFGRHEEIASEIGRRGAEMGLAANLAIAGNPDTAILAARVIPGVTIIPAGQDSGFLGAIRLDRVPLSPELAETLDRWGLKTLSDVADLPPIGLAERLGEDGVRLYNLALGQLSRPLRLEPPEMDFSEALELEDPVEELEPLLFLLARLLTELCARLWSHSRATNRMTTVLTLEDKGAYTRILEFPVPQSDSKPLLKLLQLDLEAHPAPGPVTGLSLTFNPVRPRSVQGGLFVPQEPEPARLQLTLARIEGIVGAGNVGTPRILDTHRPDAFEMVRFRPAPQAGGPVAERRRDPVRIGLRCYRPPLAARVRLRECVPQQVTAPRVTGRVLQAAGPWRTSGEWWAHTEWNRDEWDVELTDGCIYRLFCTLASRNWYVHGVYD